MVFLSYYTIFTFLQEDRVDAISHMSAIIDSTRGETAMVYSLLQSFWNT